MPRGSFWLRSICAAALVLAASGLWYSVSAAPSKAGFSRLPYVQMATPDSVVVVWRSGKIEPIVRYGDGPNSLTNSAPSDAVVVRVAPDVQEPGAAKLHSAPAGTYQYEVRLTGLKPDTKYFYGVFDGKKKLVADAKHYFVTHPETGTAKPLTFWVAGDSGTGGVDQAKVHDSMLAFTKKTNHPIDMYLHVGDMAYSDGTDAQFTSNFFKPYEDTLRSVGCWPAMGNHEGHTSKGESGIGPYYDAYVCPTKGEAGGVPSGTEAYYSFDYGRIHFICLDSFDLDRKPMAAMATWLKTDLEKVKADWLIAFWHHPPYTKGTHDSDKEVELVEMREHIMPILEGAGVDVVLTGHSHIYERSMLMDGAYATPTVAEGVILDDGDGDPKGDGAYKKSEGLNPHNGTVQVVAGHGGTGIGRLGTMPVMKRIIVEHGSVVVDIKDNKLIAVMVNKQGVMRDLFSIVKEGRVEHERIAQPKPPVEKEMPQAKSASNIPQGMTELIAKGDEWQYMAGADPSEDWTQLNFEAAGWQTGKAGFGYADNDDKTVLSDMKDKYTAVYVRKMFKVDKAADVGELGLAVNYDDAFIAYINGREVLRVGISSGAGKDVAKPASHEAEGFEYFKIGEEDEVLKDGENVLAIEGHNTESSSSDFSLDPYLLMRKK
jgi:acid phosphatase type 7